MKIKKFILSLITILNLAFVWSNSNAQTYSEISKDEGPSNSYGELIRDKIKPNIFFNENNSYGYVELKVSCLDNGDITYVEILKENGNSEWMKATTDAVYKTRTIPKDLNGRVYCPLILSFRTSNEVKNNTSLQSVDTNKETVTPNISIITDIPKFLGQEKSNSYQMMKIEGGNNFIKKFTLQISSDGRAIFINNGAVSYLMHSGNGVFLDSKNKVLVDEKNSQIKINETIVKNIQIVKFNAPSTYGEKYNIGGSLSKAIDETDLLAGCAASAIVASDRIYGNNSLKKLYVYGECISFIMINNNKYSKDFSKWKKILKNEETYSLLTYTERCQQRVPTYFINKDKITYCWQDNPLIGIHK